MYRLRRRAVRAVASTAALIVTPLLAACGQGQNFPTLKYIYVSEADCAASEKVKADECQKAIDKAVVAHDKLPIKFPTLVDCEKAEGDGRCERVAERHWRPRLMGYLFVVKGPVVTASPLYAGLKGATVFRDVAGATFDWERTEGITFSRDSIRKAEGFAPPPKGRRG